MAPLWETVDRNDVFGLPFLSPYQVVQWLNEPLADGGEEMRGMPRQPHPGRGLWAFY